MVRTKRGRYGRTGDHRGHDQGSSRLLRERRRGLGEVRAIVIE